MKEYRILKTGFLKGEENFYISNYFLDYKKLSLGAVGIFTIMAYMDCHDKKLTQENIGAKGPETLEELTTYLEELIEAKYIEEI